MSYWGSRREPALLQNFYRTREGWSGPRFWNLEVLPHCSLPGPGCPLKVNWRSLGCLWGHSPSWLPNPYTVWVSAGLSPPHSPCPQACAVTVIPSATQQEAARRKGSVMLLRQGISQQHVLIDLTAQLPGKFLCHVLSDLSTCCFLGPFMSDPVLNSDLAS